MFTVYSFLAFLLMIRFYAVRQGGASFKSDYRKSGVVLHASVNYNSLPVRKRTCPLFQVGFFPFAQGG